MYIHILYIILYNISRNDTLTPLAPHCQEQGCVACPDVRNSI